MARDKEACLAVFADDAIVEDPIGPSAFDPEGKGHRGRDAISAFWDLAIANTTKIEFFFRDTYQCGNEEANVGHRGRRVHLQGQRRGQTGRPTRVLGDGSRCRDHPKDLGPTG